MPGSAPTSSVKRRRRLARPLPLLLAALILAAWPQVPARASLGILANTELLILPPKFAPGLIGNPSTWLYGLTFGYELSPELTLRGGAYHSFRGDRQLLHVPLALTYNISLDYPIQLRPYVGLGIDLFIPSLPRPYGFGYNLHVRGGMDYIIDNQWVINANLATYIPLPGADDAFIMNLGVVGLGIGFGYKL